MYTVKIIPEANNEDIGSMIQYLRDAFPYLQRAKSLPEGGVRFLIDHDAPPIDIVPSAVIASTPVKQDHVARPIGVTTVDGYGHDHAINTKEAASNEPDRIASVEASAPGRDPGADSDRSS